ncbi:MAG: hypothetical protein WD426_09645 [Anditalea sp.]
MQGGHQPGYTYDWTYPPGWILQYRSDNTIILYVSIFDLWGKEVYYQPIKGNKVTLNLNHFRPNQYYIHILHKEGIIRRQIRIEK